MNLHRQSWFMAFLCALLFASVAIADDDQKPLNLLVIQADELNFRVLGCYGGSVVETPNLDWIAEHGALCSSFYATTPVCSPSRASLVSGRYPQSTKVVTNNIPMSDDVVTFAEVLRRRGYATGYVGKWHLDGPGKPQWAPERHFGFDDNRFMFNRGHWKIFELTDDGPRVAARDAKGRPTYDVRGADEHSFSTDWLTDRALEFLDKHAEGPFCCYLSLPDPHGPNTVRPPYDSMYQDVSYQIPASFSKPAEATPAWAKKVPDLTAQKLRKLMRPYFGMVKCIDDNVGQILDALRRRDLLDHTMVVFTADHGDLCGEHGRLNKGVPYEGSARIPFLVYCPGKVPSGTRVNQALSCVDFLPTVLALLDVPVPREVRAEGRDASPLLAGPPPDGWNDITFLRGTTDWLCAVDDRFKIVYSASGQPWLFDLKADPDELVNLFDRPEHQDTVRRLTRALLDYGRDHHDPRADQPKIRASMTSALNGG